MSLGNQVAFSGDFFVLDKMGGENDVTDIYDMSHLNDVIRTVKGGKVNALAARMGTGGDNVQLVHTYCISGNTVGREPKNGGNGIGVQEDLGYTLDTVDRHAVCIGNGQTNQPEPSEVTGALNCMHEQQSVMQGYGRIRRLTPLECERLQGLPDGYTKGGSDAARYKAIGNGMAQPCADFVLRRIAECSGEE